MTKYIEAPSGWVKSAGNKRELKSLAIFVQGASVTGSADLATAKFQTATKEFHLGGQRYAGVLIGITQHDGRETADSLAENAVILTLDQAELIASQITEAVAFERRMGSRNK